MPIPVSDVCDPKDHEVRSCKGTAVSFPPITDAFTGEKQLPQRYLSTCFDVDVTIILLLPVKDTVTCFGSNNAWHENGDPESLRQILQWQYDTERGDPITLILTSPQKHFPV